MTAPSATVAGRPLRVALFTGAYDHVRDGVALTLNRLVAHLERRGAEVLIFAPTAPTPAMPHHGTLVPIPSLPIPGRGEYRVSIALPAAARARLAVFAPDLVHVATPDLLGHLAARWARRNRVPLVASYHTRFETYLRHYGVGFLAPVVERLVDRFYGGCRHVYLPSASMIALMATKGLACELRTWTRGVEAELFSPARRDPDWRRAHGFGDDEVVIAFVGRFVREKRLDTLIAALHRLATAGVPHRVLLIGDGPDRPLLEKALPDAVFTGFLVGEALATAYASADLFVFPSDSETFGNVTLEAMASGLPAVCADATGSRSLVVEGVTGHLVDADRPDLFADRIAALIADPERRRAFARTARDRALASSWEHTLDEVLAHYREALR